MSRLRRSRCREPKQGTPWLDQSAMHWVTMDWSRWLAALGAFLQLAGVALVFWEIAETERLFHLRPWLHQSFDWITRPVMALLIRLGRRSRVSGVGLEGIGSAKTSGKARITVLRDRGKTVEERLASVQTQLGDHRRELDEIWNRIDDEHNQHERAIAEIESKMAAAIASLRKMVTGLSVGSIRTRVAGGVLILVGTALTVVAEFVA